MTNNQSTIHTGLPKKLWWIITILGLLIIFLLAIRSSEETIEMDLKSRIMNGLAKENIDWVSVDNVGRGRNVVLTGIAPSEEARDHAVDIARNTDGVRNVEYEPGSDALSSLSRLPEQSRSTDIATEENGQAAEQPASQSSSENVDNADTVIKSGTIVKAEANKAIDSRIAIASNQNEQVKKSVDKSSTADQNSDTETSGIQVAEHNTLSGSTSTSKLVTDKPKAGSSMPGAHSPDSQTAVQNKMTETGTKSQATDENQKMASSMHGATSSEIQPPEQIVMPGDSVSARVSTDTRKTVSPQKGDTPEDLSVKACQSRLDALMLNNTILFAFNSTNIQPASRPLLDQIVKVLHQCSHIVIDNGITISGHIDNMGDESYNRFLSRRQTNEVKSFLIYAGVPAVLINTVGYGASQPIATNDTNEGRAKNRRIVFTIGHN
jgi:outer membrane protein OmpA-like peptidoglycan-associated protein